MAITTQLSQELVDALEKHVGIQADAIRIVLEQKQLQMLRGQLKARGIVARGPEIRDGFSPEVWALLDEVDRSRGEQMRLKTLLSEAREQLKSTPSAKMLEPRVRVKRPGILKPSAASTPPRQFVLFECGRCHGLHAWADGPACGVQTQRYTSVNDYCMRTDVDARDVVVKTWKEYEEDIPF